MSKLVAGATIAFICALVSRGSRTPESIELT
jgi:hypothetical protein